ncbi:MAG TPA: pitrilysin family protein [Vicinamibacterales bacterium]|jgi:predicted Zn-dependent peptidase|nr:pitrilysin family protein [Vicinamibacterales bacterium]
MFRTAAILVFAFAASQTAPAPAPPQPSAPAPRPKGKAPVSNEILRVKLPRPAEADLSNGLHLIVLEDRRLPQISFEIIVPGAGGYFDAPDRFGIAAFTAAMMREGTTERTSQQIAEQIDSMAAGLTVSAGASSWSASISGSSLTEHFDRLLALTADVLLHPTFPQEELDRFKQRTRAGLVQQRSNPQFLASELYSRVLFGAHPASRVSPSLESLDKATRDALIAWHKERYVPDHAAIAVAGDISLEEARRRLESALAGWKNAGAPKPDVSNPADLTGPRLAMVARPSSVQTSLYVGTQSVQRTSPDYPAFVVANRIIGGGATGRLYSNLREQKGYTYGAYSGLSAGLYRGSWQATTDVRTEVTGAALDEIFKEITRLRTEPVPPDELQEAKRAMVASFALSLESPETVIGYYITRWQYGLPADYWDKYPERLMTVTADEVQAVARKYLDASRLQVVAVGDAKVGDVLKSRGALEVYDTEGKRIS